MIAYNIIISTMIIIMILMRLDTFCQRVRDRQDVTYDIHDEFKDIRIEVTRGGQDHTFLLEIYTKEDIGRWMCMPYSEYEWFCNCMNWQIR